VHEHIFATIVANDEAEALLGIKKFDDALAFANDLRGHAAAKAAACARACARAAAGTAAAETTAAAAAAKAIAAAEAAAVLSATEAAAVFTTKPIAFIPAATASLALTPSIETHAR